MMDDTSNSNKSQAKGEGSLRRWRIVAMGMEILDCSLCRHPLRPEIFECSCGHFICKYCHDYLQRKTCCCGEYTELLKEVCVACSRPFSQRAYGMERVLASILVPCKYHCSKKIISWYKINRHEEMYCLNGPALCPADDCKLGRPKAELLDHMSTVHKWQTTSFRYTVQFDLPSVPGFHVLRGEDDDYHIFLLTVSDALNNGHRGVYIQSVGLCAREYDFGCSVSVTWPGVRRKNQHWSGSCDKIMLTSPKNCLCVFRECDKLVLKIIMYKKANDELGWDAEVQHDESISDDGDDEDGETDDHD